MSFSAPIFHSCSLPYYLLHTIEWSVSQPIQESNTYLQLLIISTQFQYIETIYNKTFKNRIFSHRFSVELATLSNCIEVLVLEVNASKRPAIAFGPKQSNSNLDIGLKKAWTHKLSLLLVTPQVQGWKRAHWVVGQGICQVWKSTCKDGTMSQWWQSPNPILTMTGPITTAQPDGTGQLFHKLILSLFRGSMIQSYVTQEALLLF